MKNIIILFAFVTLTIFLAFMPPVPVEGMFPLSEIRKIDLKGAGLEIDIDEVYNPDGTSLIDALVNIGGCSASFVSPEGLIITNHHCSFGSVQKASTTENNYLKNGFLAATREEEIPALGITCRITVSYEDVSDEILEAAAKADDISKRTEAIGEKIKEIVNAENLKDSTITSQVSEMFTGESYVLFRYKVINDVRLVYVPPLDIGEFGGESDNWVWPRHTGDFTFLRAYVAPDGSAASYSEENVPFTPKRYLKINPEGVDEGDFVFVLGYPGRTFKNQPSYFIEHQEKYLLPFVQDLYSWMINLYEAAGKNDEEFALSISSKIKTLANTEKNYRGKMQGLNRLQIVEKKRNDEKELQNFINNNPELKNKYGNINNKIADVYDQIFDYGMLPFITRMLSQQSAYYRLAEILLENEKEKSKPDDERKILYKKENNRKLLNSVDALYGSLYKDLDRQIFAKILTEAAKYPETQSIADIEGEDDMNSFSEDIYTNSLIKDKEKYLEILKSGSLKEIDDPLINFVKDVEKTESSYDEQMSVIQGKLNILLAQFMDAKRNWMNKAFIPDANSTLRLTYGYIQGYSPADAIYHSPITTLKGVVEKGQEEGDYKINKKLIELFNKKDFGMFKDKKLDDVPVAILYSTDTSGGNSGSPVLDARGNLVGLNFDRSFEATINDYAWSEDYSRSIGVDIRYVLWVTQKIGGAGYLLKELGIL